MQIKTWAEAIKEEIGKVPQTRYQWKGNTSHGCTTDISWQGTRILNANESNPQVYCCGFTMQVFIETLKHFKRQDSISVADIAEATHYCFLRGDLYSDSMEKGLPGWLIDRGWADEITKPMEIEYGDICQIWWDWDKNHYEGHSVIATKADRKDGLPIIWTIGANYRPAVFKNPEQGGIVRDYWGWNRSGRNRHWRVARMKPEFLGLKIDELTMEQRVTRIEKKLSI